MSDVNETTVENAATVETNTTKTAAKAARLGISLDGWAVALALASAFFIWAGWIKRIPW